MNDTNILNAESVAVKLKKAEVRLRELDDIVLKAKEEKGHIDYMLSQFKNLEVVHEGARFTNRREIYKEVFAESGGKTLHSNEIMNLLKEKGYNVKKGTHHANLCQFKADPKMPIESVGVGYYKFNPNKLPY